MENRRRVYLGSRREFIIVLGGAAIAWPLDACAQQSAATVAIFRVLGLDHVSLSVADGQRTIDFYRPIFGQEIYLRPNTKAEFRISLGGMRYLAINPGRNIPPGTIDHFSIGVTESAAGIRATLGREGIAFTDDLYVKDQDGTFIQFSESADANPANSILLYPKTAAVAGLQPVFRPRGLERVTVSVANLDSSAGLYRKLCGPETRRADELSFKIGPGTLVVRKAAPGERPGINHFHVLVDRYDHAEAARRVKALGSELHFRAEGDASYFIDPDGIVVYLAEVQSR